MAAAEEKKNIVRLHTDDSQMKWVCEQHQKVCKMKSLVHTSVICMTLITLVFGATTLHTNADCSLPTVSGPCLAYFPRFSYHPSTNNCTRFVYGGCRGNANNFLTVDECNKACVHTQPSTHTSTNSICSLPTVSGLCDAYFPRFSYHPDTNKCTQFIYGGCGANQNNFLTEKECNNACVTS